MNSKNTGSGFSWLLPVAVLPLVLGLFLLWFGSKDLIARERLEVVFIGYSVVLLGFLAGTRYGIVIGETRFAGKNRLKKKHAPRAFSQALEEHPWLVPFLVGPVLGIGILLLPFVLGLAVLIVVYGAFGAWDSWAAFRAKLPADYARQRSAMTWLICLVLIIVFVLEGTR